MKRKVAVITGAAQGIGRALAMQCVARDIDVIIADIDAAALHATAQLLATSPATIIPIVTDVADEQSMLNLAEQSFAHFSQIDWVINNAGVSGDLAPIWQLNIDAIRRVMDINLYGVLHGIRAFIPYLLKQPAGHLINMASMFGLCACSKFAPYVIAKHGVIAASEVLHYDLQAIQANVNVSVVCPSFVNTKLMGDSNSENLQGKLAQLVAQSSHPNQIAAAIIAGIEQQQFYILPHAEVSRYAEQRVQAIKNQTAPAPHKVERLMAALEII